MNILFVLSKLLLTPFYIVYTILHSIVAFIQVLFEDMNKWFKDMLNEF